MVAIWLGLVLLGAIIAIAGYVQVGIIMMLIGAAVFFFGSYNNRQRR